MFVIISRRTGNLLDVFIMKSSYLNFVILDQHNQTLSCLLTLDCLLHICQRKHIHQAHTSQPRPHWSILGSMNYTLSQNQKECIRDTWVQTLSQNVDNADNLEALVSPIRYCWLYRVNTENTHTKQFKNSSFRLTWIMCRTLKISFQLFKTRRNTF